MTRSQGSEHLVEPLTSPRRRRRRRNAAMNDDQVNNGVPGGPPLAGNQPPAAGEGVANQGRRRTLRDYDNPSAHLNRRGAEQPAADQPEFDIKTGLLSLVKQHQFQGLPSENPMYHLETFEDICSTTKVNGIPDDVVKLRLFTFSLCDRAHRWLKSLEPRSIRTWEQCRNAFLEQYFTQSRTTELRNKISGFRQSGMESFSEAWERYKDYLRDCPHHGFDQSCLLNTFYRGVEERYRTALDSTSNGNFATNTEEEALVKIENMAASNNNRNRDYDRSSASPAPDTKRFEDLVTRMEQMMLKGSRNVSFCDERRAEEEAEEMFQTELNYLSGQGNFNRGFNSNFRNNNNLLSYRSTNVENPQDQYYPPRNNQLSSRPATPRYNGNNVSFQKDRPQQGFQQNGGFQGENHGDHHKVNCAEQFKEIRGMLKQLIVRTDEKLNDLQQRFDENAEEINRKTEQIENHLREIDNRVAQAASNIQRPMGTFPGKPDQNPKDKGKEICNFVDYKIYGLEDTDGEDDTVTYAGEDFDDETIEEILDEHFASLKIANWDASIGSSSTDWAMKERSSTHDKEEAKEVLTLEVPVEADNKATSDEDRIEEMKNLIDDELVVADLSEDQEIIEDMLKGKITVREAAKIITNARLERLERRTAEVHWDPGKFVIPVKIENVLTQGICDLGSNVNIMPLSLAEKLGVSNRKKGELLLADGRVTETEGWIEGATTEVGKFRIPSDFIILKYETDPPDPLIFGRAFLRNGGALIDTLTDTVQFRIGGETLTFNMKEQRKKLKNRATMGKPPDSINHKEIATISHEPP